MRKVKGASKTTVVSLSLPQHLVAALPEGNRSGYVRRLIEQDQQAAQAVRDARAALDTPGAPERVRDERSPSALAVRVAMRLDALEAHLRALGEAERRLTQQAASIEGELSTLRESVTLATQTMHGLRGALVETRTGAESRQKGSVVAQNADPFAGCADPDRPGKIRLTPSQDGSARFEHVAPDPTSTLPPPEPIARPQTRASRKEDLL
jgi:hypothetical protein